MSSRNADAPESESNKTGRMPVAGALLALIGWSLNTLYSAFAAIAGPLIIIMAAMSDAGRSAKGPLVLLICRFAAPLIIGSLLVFAGRRLAGKSSRACILDALGALLLPPVVAAIGLLVFLR